MRGMSGPGTATASTATTSYRRDHAVKLLEVTRQVRPGFRAKRRIALGITKRATSRRL